MKNHFAAYFLHYKNLTCLMMSLSSVRKTGLNKCQDIVVFFKHLALLNDLIEVMIWFNFASEATCSIAKFTAPRHNIMVEVLQQNCEAGGLSNIDEKEHFCQTIWINQYYEESYFSLLYFSKATFTKLLLNGAPP